MMPVVEVLRKLYVRGLLAYERIVTLLEKNSISEDEKRYIVTGSYENDGGDADADVGAGENTTKE